MSDNYTAVPYFAVTTKEFYVTTEAEEKIHTALKGQTVKLHSIIFSWGWLGVSKKIYFYFGSTSTDLELIATKEKKIYQFGSYDVWTRYTIPSNLEEGIYYFATRTQDEHEIKHFWKIKIVGAPTPGMGQLIVDTEPAGGTVYIDGEEVGTAPVVKDVVPGTHEVTAKLEVGLLDKMFGGSYILKSCGDACKIGVGDTCICTVKEGDTVDVFMKFEKPPYADIIKYGVIGVGAGLLLLAFMQTKPGKKAKEYIIVPAYKTAKEIGEKAAPVVKEAAKKVGGAIRERLPSKS